MSSVFSLYAIPNIMTLETENGDVAHEIDAC